MNDSATAINPFAAPAYTSKRTSSEVVQSGRASELVLRRLCNQLAIAEVSYALGIVSFFASIFGGVVIPASYSNKELQILLSYLPVVIFTITWIYLFNIHRTVQGWVGALGLLITFPIPVLGTLVFRGESVHANFFLYRNGYRRTFLGGEPIPEERQLMESDSAYVPSVYVDIRGKQRRKSLFTLGDASIFAMIGFFIVSLILI